jgi:polysaccharide biosynthesis protein PslG
MKNVKLHYNLVFLVIVMMSACIPQQPVRVLVTPTPQPASETPVSTVTDLPTSTEATEDAAVIAQAAATSTPSFLGAIVGPSYTPPVATVTPLPTTPTPTSDPSVATPTGTASTNTASTPIPTVASGPTATPLPTLDASRMGVQLDSNVDSDTWFYLMDRVSQLGVGWIKIQFPWNFYQPGAPDEWGVDMQRIELYLTEAHRRGIRVLISIAKAPNWSRANIVDDGPPDDPQVLANFITYLYSGGPQEYNLMDNVDAIEIWNEPNLAREWGGQPTTGGAYMSYFNAAYQAIRAANGSIPIITAALAPTGESDVSRDDRTYLQEMYAAGLGNYQDVYIGVHPFSWGNAPDAVCCNAVEGQGWDDDPHFFFMDTINQYREIMNQNGHENAQMWFTEFGWATWERFTSPIPQEWMSYNNEWQQGHYIVRAFEIGQQRSDVGVMFLWNLNFANETSVNGSNELAAYAILPDIRVRPAFWMVRDAVRPLDQRCNNYDTGC